MSTINAGGRIGSDLWSRSAAIARIAITRVMRVVAALAAAPHSEKGAPGIRGRFFVAYSKYQRAPNVKTSRSPASSNEKPAAMFGVK